MKKLILLTPLFVGLFVSFHAHAAVSQITQECIDRVNGHILNDFPNYSPTKDVTADQYVQQDATTFCLKYNPKTSTQSDSQYSEQDSSGKGMWNLLEDFAGNAILYKALLVEGMTTSSSVSPKSISDFKELITTYNSQLSKTKDVYQKSLSNIIESYKKEDAALGMTYSGSFAGYISQFIDEQYNDFVSFTSNITDNLSKGLVCDSRATAHQCICVDGYTWNSSHTSCIVGPSPTAVPTPAPIVKPSPTPTPQTFTDINSGTLYSDSILELAKRKVVSGYATGAYLPNNILNRAEMLKIVIGAKYGEPDQGKASACFDDIDSSQWFAKYVCFAKEKGVVKGYSDGTFKPDQEIIFSEAVKISLAAFGKTFDTDPWYKGYVDYLNMNVIDLSSTLPDEKLTRGKMAYLIRFVMDKVK